MNNPLRDIRQILINAGITQTIVIDDFVVSSNPTITNNQVNIESEPSPRVGINQHARTIIFSIYNRNMSKDIAFETSKIIFKKLNNYFGNLGTADSVRFHRIACITPPYIYNTSGRTANHTIMYLSRYEAVINDTEITSIYRA